MSVTVKTVNRGIPPRGKAGQILRKKTDLSFDLEWTPEPYETELNDHVADTGNPHAVTKAQIGLSDVDNTSDSAKPLSSAATIALAAKAPLASPSFSGTPVAPTATLGTNTTQLATTEFVKAAVDALLAAAPGALDTLDELAAALGDDANFAATVTTALALKAPLASPALTGSPTAPTQTADDNSTKLATTAYADNLLADPRGETAIASAGTCDIGAAATARVEITGTTTITSFGSSVNKLRFIRFAGILALTHHATSLILPGGGPITTAAGDTAIALSDASGNWRVQNFTRADGTPINASSGSVPVGSSILWNQSTPPSGYLEEDGTAVSRATYPALFAVLVRSATATMTIATPGVVTWTGHTLKANDPIKFSTTGALPTGVVAGTTYYVKSPITNAFNISATPGGAAINTTGSQSGVHTAINAPFGDGDGSTTFNLPESRGEFIRGWANGRAVDTSRSFGSAQVEMIGPHSHPVPSYNSGAVGASGRPQEGTTGSADTFDTSNNTGTENRPRNIARMYCIKY